MLTDVHYSFQTLIFIKWTWFDKLLYFSFQNIHFNSQILLSIKCNKLLVFFSNAHFKSPFSCAVPSPVFNPMPICNISLATLDYVRDEIEKLWGSLSSHGGHSSAVYAQPLQYRNCWWNTDFVLGWEGGATFPSLPGWQVRWLELQQDAGPFPSDLNCSSWPKADHNKVPT